MTLPDVSIRLMRPGEEAEVCALVARVFELRVAPGFSPAGIEEFYRYIQPETMADRLEASGKVLVAEQAQQIVGMLEFRGFDHIALFFVEREGRRIGRRLLAAALHLCRERRPDIQQVRIHASDYALPIYRRFGFEVAGARRTEHGITYWPMVFNLEAKRS